MNNEEKLNISLTFIVQLLEIINRIVDTEIDNPELKQLIKKDFNAIVKQGRKLDSDYRKYIRQMTDKYDDPEEFFDCEVDYLYDIIMATVGLKNNDQYIKAISSIKLLAK